MSSFSLFVIVLALVFGHCAWLALFAMEVLFDTSRETAAGRWRILTKYIVFGAVLDTVIAVLIWVLLSRGSSPLG